jgi:hypothetical protein
LVVGDFVESRQDSVIDGSTMTKKSTGDTLCAGGAFFVEQGGGVISGVLCFLTTDWFGPEMRSMLSKFGRQMLMFGASFVDEFGHGDVNVRTDCSVIPVESHTKTIGSGPVLGEGMFVLESGEQVLGINFAKMFNTEIADCKRESGATDVTCMATWS